MSKSPIEVQALTTLDSGQGLGTSPSLVLPVLFLSFSFFLLFPPSRCCVFALLPVLLCTVCSSACQGRVPVCFFPLPPPFSVLCSACLLCRCFVVAGCPCSLPPSLPLPVCACLCPELSLTWTNVFPRELQQASRFSGTIGQY